MRNNWRLFLLSFFLVICLVFSNLGTQKVYSGGTQDLGMLSYWYSDFTAIARWNSSNFTIYFHNYSSMPPTEFPFTSAYTHAIYQWVNGLPATITSTTSSTCSFKVLGGSPADYTAAGINPSSFSSLNGLTTISYTYEGNWGYSGTPASVDGYLVSSATCYIVENGRTENEYKKTITHEMGHGIGWLGHSGVSTDIMYYSGSSITSLTSRDINHISQIY